MARDGMWDWGGVEGSFFFFHLQNVSAREFTLDTCFSFGAVPTDWGSQSGLNRTGALIRLFRCGDSACHPSEATKQWASPSNPIGRYVYRSRSHEAGVNFYDQYRWEDASWGPRVYEKIGVNSSTANETLTYAKVVGMSRNGSAVVVDLQPPEMTSLVYGGPQKVRVVYALGLSGRLDVALVIQNKTTTRLPEEAWWEFRPVLAMPSTLAFEKLGSNVDPTSVLTNGSKTLHAVGDERGATFTTGTSPGKSSHQIQLVSLDAGLISPGSASANMDLYAFPGEIPKAEDGCAVSLWNNLWSVNCEMPLSLSAPFFAPCHLFRDSTAALSLFLWFPSAARRSSTLDPFPHPNSISLFHRRCLLVPIHCQRRFIRLSVSNQFHLTFLFSCRVVNQLKPRSSF